MLARNRLTEERKNWRKDHPHGFFAKPEQAKDGSVNLMVWTCGVPGRPGTAWEAGVFPVTLKFPDEYPSAPPQALFPANFFHPNVFPTGLVCLSILNEDKDWRPSITVKQILLGLQDLLSNPNAASPAQTPAYNSFTREPREYEERVRKQAALYSNYTAPTN